MKFSKISRTNSHVVCKWESQPTKKSKFEHHELECQEAPLVSFDKALANLVPHFIEILGLGSGFNENRVTIKGVSLTRNDEDEMYAIITGSVTTKGAPGPFTINTPRLPEKADDSFHLSTKCCNAIAKLVEEAAKYVKGDRQQGVMLEIIKDDPKDEEEPEQGKLGV